MHNYDLFVIGGGSGGVRAARVAAGYGARVAIAEENRIGGTCVIRGCVPKKLMVYASRFSDNFTDCAGFGWSVSDRSFDWGFLISSIEKQIGRLESRYCSNLLTSKVDIFSQRARIRDPHTVTLCGSGREVTAKKVLIATGGSPFLDKTVDGYEHVVTSDYIFQLRRRPKKVVLIGGGYIAVEFAGIFSGLGVDTTLVYRGEKILRRFDDDLRTGLTECYLERSINVIVGARPVKYERSGEQFTVVLSNGSAVEADLVVSAIGRRPNTRGLGLEAAGVELGKRGQIIVGEDYCSSCPSIFAVGDVIDRVNLTPVAIREGQNFAELQYGKGQVSEIDYELIPTAVFSTPEIGTVGFTQETASRQYKNLHVYKSQFCSMKSTLSGSLRKTQMKLLVDGDTDRVLGCHILGEDAAEIIQIVGVAMQAGAKKSDFDRTMALHPSSAEELVTMRFREV